MEIGPFPSPTVALGFGGNQSEWDSILPSQIRCSCASLGWRLSGFEGRDRTFGYLLRISGLLFLYIEQSCCLWRLDNLNIFSQELDIKQVVEDLHIW